MKKYGIPYANAPWGPWSGCTPVSEGCRNCYAKRIIEGRFKRDFSIVTRASDATFFAPLHRKQPTRYFVCPGGDFFHPAADRWWRVDALRVIQKTPRHTYIIVTKRPERIIEQLYDVGDLYNLGLNFLPNVWFLVSVEDQETADLRIPQLLKLREHPSGGWPVLGVSHEPAISPVAFQYHRGWLNPNSETDLIINKTPQLDWIVMGGESGSNARPMHPNWVRCVRNTCIVAGVPFWFKQWGPRGKGNLIDGEKWEQLPEGRTFDQ